MNWFEKLTGFAETNYHDTRKKLRVEGRQIQSLSNGDSYGIGRLELVSLRALRERVKSGGGLPGKLGVSVVQGDVRRMHRLPENAGALFQVRSGGGCSDKYCQGINSRSYGKSCTSLKDSCVVRHANSPKCRITHSSCMKTGVWVGPLGGVKHYIVTR